MDHHSTHDHASGTYTNIEAFGVFHHSSSHTTDTELQGGRTPITTEAFEAYNGLRGFFGLSPVDLETVGQWAFANTLTNNQTAWGDDLKGVGLYYGMQGAKVGWIADDEFDPMILADIQRTARQGDPADVMKMVQDHGHTGFAEYLHQSGLVDHFINTLKMEPHYGGWMHGRVHGWLPIDDESGAATAIAHDLNHLTVLSHDQTQPFMNDTFDWPQWPALNVPQEDVIEYFQSMVSLGDPRGENLFAEDIVVAPVDPAPVDPEPMDPDPIEPNNPTDANVIIGGAGNDQLKGKQKDDYISGEGGDDRLLGVGGSDTIDGGTGNDVIFGGSGDDQLTGDAGEDRIFGEDGADTLDGGSDNDELFGGGEADQLNGGTGSDRAFGGGGDDVLNGGEGADKLFGGSGDDTIDGGRGAGIDRATGGAGADRYVYQTGDARFIVTDFEAGEDIIDLVGIDPTNFGNWTFKPVGGGANTLVQFGGGDEMRLDGVTASEVDQSWFV